MANELEKELVILETSITPDNVWLKTKPSEKKKQAPNMQECLIE